MVWNAPHLHLMINHLPVFAPLLAIPLLAIALWKREEKGAFIGAVLLLVLGAIGAFVSVQTGERAGDALTGEQGVSMLAMSAHEELAEGAAITLYVVAMLAIVAAVMRFRNAAPASPLWIGILLGAALMGAGIVGNAAMKGGEIRHPEIRPADSALEQSSKQADDD